MEYKWLTQGESLREWRRMYWQRPHNPLVLIQIPVQTPNSQFSPLPVSPPWQLQVCLGFSSVAQLRPTLSDLMDCSRPGFPLHHQFPELAQTHVHRFGYAIQPSHPLSSPSPPAFNLSQHQGLFQLVRRYKLELAGVNYYTGVAKKLFCIIPNEGFG